MIQYNTDFPEEYFTGNARKISHYWDTVQNALNEYSKNEVKIMICGIARNCDENIERNIQRLHRTGEMFKDYKAFIYENNSTDDTKAILNEYKNDKLEVVSEDLPETYPMNDIKNHYHRCVKIAEARNKYMDLFVQKYYEEYPITLIIDLDIIGGWSYEGLQNCVNSLLEKDLHKKTAGITSYGVITGFNNWKTTLIETVEQANLLMYDTFAFRPYFWFKKEDEENSIDYLDIETQVSFATIRRPSANYKVMSNFGGLGIYRSEILNKFRYKVGEEEEQLELCDSEHVSFHRKMCQNGYHLMMNNRLLTSYSPTRYCHEYYISN
jgi:hypothetical protein